MNPNESTYEEQETLDGIEITSNDIRHIILNKNVHLCLQVSVSLLDSEVDLDTPLGEQLSSKAVLELPPSLQDKYVFYNIREYRIVGDRVIASVLLTFSKLSVKNWEALEE